MRETSFRMDENGTHHLVIADRSGWPAARALLSNLRTNRVERCLVRPRMAARRSCLQDIFSRQPMGTRLYVAGIAAFVEQVRSEAYSVGFSAAEVTVLYVGPPAPHVFCMACYHRFEHPGTNTADCPTCGQRLELTEHVSDRLQAVMGCVALPAGHRLPSGTRGDRVG